MTGEKNKMDISALITEDQILIDLNSKSKKNILEIISQKLACDNLENKDIIFNKLYEREKLGNSQNKMGLKGFKWSSLNAPGTETPQSHPCWEKGNSSNSHNWPSGVIRIGSPV